MGRNVRAVCHQKGRTYHLKPKHCVVRCAQPRLLIVSIRAPFCHINIAVANAPQQKIQLNERRQWWQRFSTQIAHIPIQYLLIDANARLGSVQSEAVGPHGYKQQEDSNGALLHQFLLDNALEIPVTKTISLKSIST